LAGHTKMAATNFTPISLYYSTTASTAPTAGNLVAGELAINTNDGVLYYKDSSGVVQSIASKAGNSGSFTNLAYTGTLTGGTGVVNLGSGQFYKDASGNVGIGYIPSGTVEKLSVSTSSGFGLGFNTNSTYTNWVTAKITPIDFGLNYTGGLAFYTNSGPTAATAPTEKMRIDASGNVGIGVTANTTNLGSTYKLLSVGTSGGSGIFMGQSDSTASGSSVAQFFGKTTGTAGYQLAGGMIVTLDGTSTTNAVGRLQFYTASGGTVNEAMRIDSSGNLLVGATTTNLIATNTAGFVFKTGGGLQFVQTGNTSDWGVKTTSGNIVNFYSWNGSAGVYAGSITVNGNITTYTSISDYRLKENVAPLIGALDKISQLKPVTFDFKDGGQKSQGFIAHELQAVVPDCVTGEKDAVDAEGKPVYQGIDTSFLVATLTAAIQEQQALITTMQAKLKDAGILGF